jgi:hypothetical protein
VTIGATQRVVAVLNVWSHDQPMSYVFDAISRSEDSQTIVIPFQGVQAAEYLVRLMIDGAESQLVIDDHPNSPTYQSYIGPKIDLTSPLPISLS